jgi:Fic family protein
MNLKRDVPYNDLPLLPPEVDLETRSILRALIPAARSLAELKLAGELIPNQSILINTIPLLEAQLSSEIENIVTTTDKLFQLAGKGDSSTDPATKETLRYRGALYEGFKMLHEYPVCSRTAIQVCRTIRNVDVGIRNTTGTKIGKKATGEIIYTPPEGVDCINEKLANWELFINSNDELDPLIRMAVMHYQFEAIHPFTDGNGRTGRVLNILYLIQEGLLEIPVLYLSRYIIRTKELYYQLLRNVTEKGDWEAWIIYMLIAIKENAEWTSGKIRAIRNLIQHTCDYVQESLPSIYSRELVELIFTQPYARIANVVDLGLAKRQTASVYLKEMVKIGVLKETRLGKEKLFVHPKLMTLLTSDENSFAPYDANQMDLF